MLISSFRSSLLGSERLAGSHREGARTEGCDVFSQTAVPMTFCTFCGLFRDFIYILSHKKKINHTSQSVKSQIVLI